MENSKLVQIGNVPIRLWILSSLLVHNMKTNSLLSLYEKTKNTHFIYTASFCVILLICINCGKILGITEYSYLSGLLCLRLPINIMLLCLVLWYKLIVQ